VITKLLGVHRLRSVPIPSSISQEIPLFSESAYGERIDGRRPADVLRVDQAASGTPLRWVRPEREELTMNAGLHAIRWGLSRCAVALGLAVLAVVLAYVTWVFVLVAIQAVGGIGQ
jgi:hypothetical protein